MNNGNANKDKKYNVVMKLIHKMKRKNYECMICGEDFNSSYYKQLLAEYKILTEKDKSNNISAVNVIEEIIEKVKTETHPSCDHVFQIEKALIQLQSTEKITLELDNLRDKYKRTVTPSRYNNYIKQQEQMHTKSIDKNSETHRNLLLSDVNFLMSEIHLMYTLIPVREKQRSELLINIIEWYSFLLLVILLSIGLKQTVLGIQLLLLVAMFGALGAFISLVQRLQEVPILSDPVENFLSMKYGRVSIYIAPVSGAISSIVLFMLFTGGMVTGSIFPKLEAIQNCNSNINEFLFKPFSNLTYKEYSILFTWAFIAGFAERFVPDTLDRLIARKDKREQTSTYATQNR